MAEEFKIRFKTVIKNVIPAVVVMAAGLGGTYVVYNNYLSDRVSASQVSGLEPAAGGDETITAAPAAAPATSGGHARCRRHATGAAPAAKVYNDEGEDSGNGPDAAAPASGSAPAGGTAAPAASPDAPVKASPDSTSK